MKKIAFGLIALVGMAFSSCDMGSNETTAKDSFFSYNMMTPLDGGATDVCASYYVVNMNVTKATATLASALVYNKSQMTFTTNEMSVQQYSYSNYFSGFTGYVNNQTSMPLEDGRILMTYNYVFPYATFTDPADKNNQFKLSEFYPNKQGWASGGDAIDGVMYLPNYGGQPVVVGSYKIGQDYLVNAFSSDCTYQGTTLTEYEYNGHPDQALKQTIYYRIVLDVTKSKAYVAILNAKFSNAEGEPAKPVVYLEDLDVEWGAGSYKINATNVVPKMIENNKLEARPDYTFKSFTMQTTGNWMEGAVIKYTVEALMQGNRTVEYKGTFNGNYVSIPDNLPK